MSSAMNLKYEITDQTRQTKNGRMLYRIRALRDFDVLFTENGDWLCAVKKGELGGWVEHANNLSQKGTCWVANDAAVYENGCFSGDGRLYDEATICNNAKVCGGDIGGHASIFGDARISGRVQIGGYSCVCGTAGIRGVVALVDNSTICDDVKIAGVTPDGVTVCGSILSDSACIQGSVTVSGSRVNGNAIIGYASEGDEVLELHDLVIGGNAHIASPCDFLCGGPFNVAFNYLANATEAVPTRLTEICTDPDPVAFGNLTFYSTENPDVAGFSIWSGDRRNFEITADTVISDEVFYLFLRVVLTKFELFDLLGKIKYEPRQP
jgi:hypothetical protein